MAADFFENKINLNKSIKFCKNILDKTKLICYNKKVAESDAKYWGFV